MRPKLTDDGTAVELDIHGVPIGRAMELISNALRTCSSRGRGSLRIIHGYSTFEAGIPSIRGELTASINAGNFSRWMESSVLLNPGVTLIAVTRRGTDRTLITLRDIW